MLRILTRRALPIGLDITTDAVRMMQLGSAGKGVAAIAAAQRMLPPGVGDDPGAFASQVSAAIKEMLAAEPFRGQRVVTCLGSAQVAIKQTRLPRLSSSERESAVRWEANDRFDFEVEPELLHHLVAGEVRAGSDMRDEVIMLAVAEQDVDAHVKMLDGAGLNPVAVDAEPACVFRPFERFLRRGADASKVSAIVDIRPENTWVLFARGRDISFIKSVTLGDSHFTRAMAEQLSIDYAEAVRVRRQLVHQAAASVERAEDDSLRRAMRDAIRPVAEELAREISLCLRYCAVTFRGSPPECVTLVGPGAAEPNARELLSKAISLTCEIGRPLRGVDLSGIDVGTDHRGPWCEWSVAAGLALRGTMANQDRREGKDETDRLSA